MRGESGVPLIAGLEYGMEWWNGKWNGTVNVAIQLQLTHVTQYIGFVLKSQFVNLQLYASS